MSFKENPCQQLSINDSFYGLTTRGQKALEKSWAKVFAEAVKTTSNWQGKRTLTLSQRHWSERMHLTHWQRGIQVLRKTQEWR